MDRESPALMLNKHGHPVMVKRIAQKGKRGKLSEPDFKSNSMSPFDRFSSTNGSGFIKSY